MPITKEELLEQYDVLKTAYIKLLNDKDVLLNWGKPQLEALYATKIGVHQIEKLKQQLQLYFTPHKNVRFFYRRIEI